MNAPTAQAVSEEGTAEYYLRIAGHWSLAEDVRCMRAELLSARERIAELEREKPKLGEPVSSADAHQRRGLFESPEYWREACRLFRARCSFHDCEAMARLRTYIEEGNLVAVRPEALERLPKPAEDNVALVERWIPVNESLPPFGKRVLVTINPRDGSPEYVAQDRWRCGDNDRGPHWGEYDCVIAWRELPPAFREPL